MASTTDALPRYLIVDGHSMIFAWEELRGIHETSTRAARNELIHRMTSYQDITGELVVLVFDGKGKTATPEHAEGGIQVFYSPAGITADQIIERLAGKYAQRRQLTVASRDRGVLDTCASFGANTISARALHELLERAGRKLNQRIQDHRQR